MIFGIQCLNSGGFTKLLGEIENLQIGLLSKKIKFTKDLTITEKLPQPTFYSFWVCNNILDSKLMVLDYDK